jgi:hypothetical protein
VVFNGCCTYDVNLSIYPALALPGQGLKKSPIGQKLDFANHPYLCKGLYIIVAFFKNASILRV